MDESLRSMLKLKQSMFDVNENAMMSAKLISERDEIIKNQQLRINQLEQDVKHLTSKNAVSFKPLDGLGRNFQGRTRGQPKFWNLDLFLKGTLA